MTLIAIEPEQFTWFPYKGHTFCLGVREGRAAWTSGQSAAVFDAGAGKSVVTGTMREQAALSYTKLLEVIADAGLSPADVVHVTENVTAAGVPHYADAEAVRAELFGDHVPTVTTVVVDRLVRGKALLELELHAIPGGGVALVDGTPRTVSRSPVREGHEGEIHLPTILPVDVNGDVVSVGDPASQYVACMEILEALLEEAGLDASDVVSCAEYITPDAANVLAAMATARSATLGRETVGGTVVMKTLHRPGVLVAIDVIATRRPTRVIDPGWGRFDALPYRPAIQAGTTVYMSALSSLDPSTGGVLHPGDLAEQAEETYRQLEELVNAAGTTVSEVRSTIEFCVSDMIGTYRAVAPVRARRLSAPWPASTGDLCTGFATDGLLLQTMATAHTAAR